MGTSQIGLDDWRALIRDYPTNVVLAPNYFPVYESMHRQPQWQQVYTDQLCGIFVKQRSPEAAAIQASEKPVQPLAEMFP